MSRHPRTQGQPVRTALALPARRALRVMSGAHAGAQIDITQERTLVGNIETECDLVLDVTRPERHACLLRTSPDGWTVLAIAGDLWVGDRYVETTKTADLRPGEMLTLGRVAFCIADPETTDWSELRLPGELKVPTPDGEMPRAAIPAQLPEGRKQWNRLRVGSGIAVAIALCTASVSYLMAALEMAPIPSAAVARIPEQARQVLASLPAARELQVSQHPENIGRVVLHGYVPTRGDLDQISARLQQADVDAEFRVSIVHALSLDIAKRLDGADATKIRYEGKGRFSMPTRSEIAETHHRQARTVMQELPAIERLSLTVTDALNDEGTPHVLSFSRKADRPGDIAASPIDPILGRQVYVLREVRQGSMPSIVLENGQRYFAGARLPNGAFVQRIETSQVIIARPGGAEVAIPIPRQLAVAAARNRNAEPAVGTLARPPAAGDSGTASWMTRAR